MAARRIGLLTSGGDCPGLNAAIRAVVRRGVLGHGFEIVGIEDGTRGLLERRSVTLSPEDLDQGGMDPMLRIGGTVLGSISRTVASAPEQLDAGYRDLELDAIVCIGGDGSLRIIGGHAQQFGWPLVAIPKTIDNDVACTDRAIGFDSAVHTVVRGIDHLRTTGVSHDRVMVLETMGRTAGHLALRAGIAGGADVILLPEVSWTLEGMLDAVQRTRASRRHTFAVIVVAEGVELPAEVELAAGGVGDAVARSIEQVSGGVVEARATVLGHLQRGGPPSPVDVELASAFGVHAIDLVAAGRSGVMAALHGDEIVEVPLGEVITIGARKVDPAGRHVELARALGIYVGED